MLIYSKIHEFLLIRLFVVEWHVKRMPHPQIELEHDLKACQLGSLFHKQNMSWLIVIQYLWGIYWSLQLSVTIGISIRRSTIKKSAFFTLCSVLESWLGNTLVSFISFFSFLFFLFSYFLNKKTNKQTLFYLPHFIWKREKKKDRKKIMPFL